MFLDLDPARYRDEPIACKSCKQSILSNHTTEQVKMPFDQEQGLHELNGVYHSECAKPYLSIMRALDVLTRLPF